MNDIDNLTKEIDESKSKINDYAEARHTAKIIKERGRLISKVKKLIKKLNQKENKTSEDEEYLKELNELLTEQLYKHKTMLNERYKKSFINEHARVSDIVTTLPYGIYLQVQKVSNAINELKNAKEEKARSLATVNVLKEVGFLVGTPIHFAGKFAIEHWYLLLLGLKLPELEGFFKQRQKVREQKPQEQVQEQEVPDSVSESVPQRVGVSNEEPVPQRVGAPNEEPVPQGVGVPIEEPVSQTTGVQVAVPEPQTTLSDYLGFSSYESPADAFINKVNENGLLGEKIQLYRNQEEVIRALGFNYDDYVKGLVVIPKEVFYDKVWLIGKGGLFASEEAFISALNVNVSSFESFINNNPEMLEFFKQANENAALLEDLTFLSPKTLENLKNIGIDCSIGGAGLTTLYALYKLAMIGLAIPTGGATLAMP